ncbi:BURP domain-containing protein, partial [Salmonella sp. NW860]|uniref:BURP domain-containing protein n=1 Tax=Salmonella sp. NW860 TaxID=2948342 RepID=UPI003F41FE41
ETANSTHFSLINVIQDNTILKDLLSFASMACNMWFSTALVVLLLYVAVGSEEVQAESSASPTLSYWHRKLPTTPIPDALQQLIFPFSSQKTSELLYAIREGNKVSTGEAPLTSELVRTTAVPTGHIYKAELTAIIADPSLSAMFFLEKDLRTGAKLKLYRKNLKRSSPDSRIFFLPRRLAEAIPFSSDKLSVALEMLNISQGSDAALAMKHSLQLCESPAISGEIKYCPTSLESMIDYATSNLGTSGVSVLETNVPCNLNSQRYTITGIPFQSKSGLKSVICHSLIYPYAVYDCHQLQQTTAARVSLKGDDGSTGEGSAVCHSNTSAWSPQHFAFKLLNVKPGGATICHFLNGENVVWVPVSSTICM